MAKNEVRIIGGKWRGRKLKFPDVRGLRPSQDRGRETLFNWITPWVVDANVLDLFAGSGALGFEALSRGAASAELVDNEKLAAKALETSKALLGAENAQIYCHDALAHLQQASGRYDLVFLDPPFERSLSLVQPALVGLLQRNLLSAEALIYVEQPKKAPLELELERLSIYRDKAFGDSRALLLQPQLEPL